MQQNWTRRTVCTFACLVAGMLLAAVAAQAATVAQPPTAGRGFGFAYDATHEVTLVGTVKGFDSHPAKGSPVGLHLLVVSSGKVVDAHVGPFLSKQNQKALHAGQLVQIVGVNESVHGKNVLLARQLVFAGRQVKVRNEHGFLMRDRSGAPARQGNRTRKPAVDGGAQ